jgi:hypothetical protein
MHETLGVCTIDIRCTVEWVNSHTKSDFRERYIRSSAFIGLEFSGIDFRTLASSTKPDLASRLRSVFSEPVIIILPT